ncbi:caspase family protein [Siphonobacter aquaeclarae]|jgi:hypothetical protein|uniref:Caspase domain-containing protein n=1 Tax=Siphonobacter aquaeclarae TaxID=563176 RepID=A0A1G9IMX7_9BACT|nr:caspase family protein [Siphonobacter aquaeclarae]SDL26502.1 Caspase domain-containing protein [Siphonobacter aquaeclarae]
MKKLALCLLMSIGLSAHGQTFHALLMADTRDELLSGACERDLEVMHRQFEQISSAIGFQLSEKVISRDFFTVNELEKVLDSLRIAPDDVVFFYYTGHGYNVAGRADRFPILHVDKKNIRRNPELSAIHERLRAKKPRLCISLGDCCNDLLTSTRGMVSRKPMIRGLNLTDDSLNASYRRLFRIPAGDILIASSQPPQQSSAHPDSGSFYTRSFTEALETATRFAGNPTWEALLSDTQARLGRHSATREKKSLYRVRLAGAEPSPSPVNFPEISRYLNSLINTDIPDTKRFGLVTDTRRYFTEKARVNIYVNNTLGEVQPIEQVARRLYLNADKIRQVNLIERLSTVDGKVLRTVAIQEIW